MFETGILSLFGEDAILGFAGGMVVTACLVQWIKTSVLPKEASNLYKALIVILVSAVVAIAWDSRDGIVEWDMIPSVIIVYVFSSVTLYGWIIKPMLENLKKRGLIGNSNGEGVQR